MKRFLSFLIFLVLLVPNICLAGAVVNPGTIDNTMSTWDAATGTWVEAGTGLTWDGSAFSVDGSLSASGISDSSTEATKIAAGGLGSRPTGTAGQIRYNSTTGELEFFGSSWTSIQSDIVAPSTAAGQLLVGDAGGGWDVASNLLWVSDVLTVGNTAFKVDDSGTYPFSTFFGGAADGSVGTAVIFESANQDDTDGGGISTIHRIYSSLGVAKDLTQSFYWDDELAGMTTLELAGADRYDFNASLLLPNSSHLYWRNNADTANLGLTLNTSDQIEPDTDLVMGFLKAKSGSDINIWMGDAAGVNSFTLKDSSSVDQFVVDSDGEAAATGAFVMTPYTSDPCGTLSEGALFYNDTSDYPCYCNGSGADLKMDGTTACF